MGLHNLGELTPVNAPIRAEAAPAGPVEVPASLPSGTPAPREVAEGTRTIAIDLVACRFERFALYLPLGSEWGLIHPVDDRVCEVWLGGETENPAYDGRPDHYCRFHRCGSFDLELGAGGPVSYPAGCVAL